MVVIVGWGAGIDPAVKNALGLLKAIYPTGVDTVEVALISGNSLFIHPSQFEAVFDSAGGLPDVVDVHQVTVFVQSAGQ
jgi:hypothetical protein